MDSVRVIPALDNTTFLGYCGPVEDKAQEIYERELRLIESQRRERRHRAIKVGILVGAILLVLSGLLLSNAGHTSEWQMLDPPVGTTIAISGLLGASVAFVMARRDSDIGIVLGLLIAATAGLAFGLVGFGYFSGANAWFDGSPAEHHRVEVHERLEKRSSKSIVNRKRLVVESWRTPGTRETIYVEPAIHDANPSSVIVTTHAGLFGFEWIADVAVASRRPRERNESRRP